MRAGGAVTDNGRVDNLCHTLVGAAIGYAGLRRKSPLATATLMVAANLPDLDVLVFATDTPSIEFRRGWTHGVAGQVLLPLLLTGVMVAIGRRRGVRPGWLLALSYIGVFSHVFLDFLNNYGVRLLAPVDWRWFYGDAVFIIDPWLWLLLGIGVWISRRRGDPAPARRALWMASAYIAGMLLSAMLARSVVTDAWREQRGVLPEGLMVGPVPVNPFARQIILDDGGRYWTGRLTLIPLRLVIDPQPVPRNDRLPAVRAARGTPALRSFLVWSRFPYYQVERDAAGVRVSVGDMRFAGNPLGDALGRGRFTASAVLPAP